jgi:MFS family permease
MPEHSDSENLNCSLESTTRSGDSARVTEPIRRLWIWCALAGLCAGLLSWAGGEVAWKGIRVAQTPKIVPFPTAEDRARVIRSVVASTAVSFIQQGAILGAMLGLVGWLARRASRLGSLAAMIGAGLGALAAAAAAFSLLPIYFRNVGPQGESLALPILTHGGIWGAVGAAAGLALAIGLGERARWAKAALGGLLGGIVAALVYDLVGAVAFPLDKTSQPVSATVATRLLAQTTAAVIVALGASLGASDAVGRAPDEPRPQ